MSVMKSTVFRAPAARFALSSLLVVLACVTVLRIQASAANSAIAAWGATFDLTITIPLLYWFFVVRTGKAKPLSIAPVFIAGTLLALMVIPRGEQQFLRQLRVFIVPAAEILLLLTIGQRSRRIAAVVRSELAMFYYAFCCWGKKAETRGTTFHERSGWSSIVVCIIVLIVAESIGMHFFLRMWKPLAAWIWTGLDLWAVIWLLGDYHALRLLPTTLNGAELDLRLGIRWHVRVSLANIASIRETRDEAEWKRREVLRFAILDEPRWLITLHEPLMATGLAGFQKRVTALAVLPDDEELITRLRVMTPVQS
jgi:hypothetical protein